MGKVKLERPLTSEWKTQIAEMFLACKSTSEINDLYKRLFRHYYFKRYNGPDYLAKTHKEWNEVEYFLGEQARRNHGRFRQSSTPDTEKEVREDQAFLSADLAV